MINALELLRAQQDSASEREARRRLSDLAEQKFAAEQALVPQQLERQRLSDLMKMRQFDNQERRFEQQQQLMRDRMAQTERLSNLRFNRPKEDSFELKETPEGFISVNKRTGEAFPLTMGGKPVMGKTTEKPLTEAQGTATGFGMRAIRSDQILKELEDAGVANTGILRSAAQTTVGVLPLVGDKLSEAVGSTMNVLPGWAGGPSPEQQQTEQARRDFVNAILRKESGAVISQSEFENAAKQYFPQPGDDKKTIENKRRNRETAIEAMRVQAGPGASRIVAPKKPDGAGVLSADEMRELELLRRQFGRR